MRQKNKLGSWKTNWWKSVPQNRKKKRNDSLGDLWNIKHTNIHFIGVSERGEREKGPDKISEETIAENFPNMEK